MPGTPHSSWSSCSLSLGLRSWMTELCNPCPVLGTATDGSSAIPVWPRLEHWEEDNAFYSGRTTAALCQR